MKRLGKRRMLALGLSLAVILGGGSAGFAAEAGAPAAETEVLLYEDFESEITDGTTHAVPTINEWHQGPSAEVVYQGGRVYFKKTNDEKKAYDADLVLPFRTGYIGGQEPAAQGTPATDIYLEFDWQAATGTTRLYIQGIDDKGKGVNLFYLTQSGSQFQYNTADTKNNVSGTIKINQTSSHMIRLLMHWTGTTYAINTAWVDGALDKEMSLTATVNCAGLYCFKTDERINSGQGLGSSFGSLKVWQPAEVQLQALIDAEGGSPSFSDIQSGNTSADSVTGDLDLKTGVLTQTGLLITEWKTSHPEIISASGEVARPEDEDTEVTLTPVLAINDVIGDNFETGLVTAEGAPITVTVTSTQLDEVKNNLSFEAIKGQNTSADSVTEDLNLIQAMSGVQIEWEVLSVSPSGTHAEIDPLTGSVKRPYQEEQDVQVTLKANLTRGVESGFKTITVTVKKLEAPPEEYVKELAERLTFSDIANGNQDGEHVTSDLNLMRSFNGAEVVWTSSDSRTVTAEGKVIRPIDPKPAVRVTLTAELTYNKTYQAVKTIAVTVQPTLPENLARNGEIRSNLSGVTAADLEKLRDGDENTYVEVPAKTKSFYLTMDLGEAKAVSRFEFTDAALDTSAVEQYTVEVSQNGTKWTEVFKGSGSPGQNAADFLPVEARYVRFSVPVKTANAACYLAETAVRFWPSDLMLVHADAEAFVLDLPNVITGDTITLPLTGKFGSEIKWSFKPENLIRETSVEGTYQVTHSTANTAATLTVSFHSGEASEQRRMTRTISGTGAGTGGSGDSGGSGGGGSGSRPSGGGSASIGSGSQASSPRLPQQADEQEPARDEAFQDLAEAEWAAEYISGLYQAGIVNGKEEGRFRPLDPVTREEFVKMLVLSLELDPAEGNAPAFSDVDVREWYAPYIACAAGLRIINGISEDEFGVGTPITREDMAVMTARALQADGAIPEGTLFADQNEISDYALASVAKLAELELVQGDESGRFRPKDNTSRAEVAKVLYLLRSAVK